MQLSPRLLADVIGLINNRLSKFHGRTSSLLWNFLCCLLLAGVIVIAVGIAQNVPDARSDQSPPLLGFLFGGAFMLLAGCVVIAPVARKCTRTHEARALRKLQKWLDIVINPRLARFGAEFVVSQFRKSGDSVDLDTRRLLVLALYDSPLPINPSYAAPDSRLTPLHFPAPPHSSIEMEARRGSHTEPFDWERVEQISVLSVDSEEEHTQLP